MKQCAHMLTLQAQRKDIRCLGDNGLSVGAAVAVLMDSVCRSAAMPPKLDMGFSSERARWFAARQADGQPAPTGTSVVFGSDSNLPRQ